MNNNKEWIKPAVGFLGAIIVINELKGLKNVPFFGGAGEHSEHVTDRYEQHVDTIKNNAPNQNNLTLPRQAYKDIALQQYEAMNRPGTDESLLFDSLRGLNKDDLLTVFMDFGLRARVIFGVATTARRNLIEWYRKELDGQELSDMLQIWRVTGLTR